VVQVVVGRIGRPHGVRGELSVQSRTDEPERRFAAGVVLHTDHPPRKVLTVRAARPHGNRLLVSFAEVADRTSAEALHGVLLSAEVDEAERPEDPEEFYDRQLLGLAAVTTDGRAVGVVSDVLHLPAHDLLAIRPTTGPQVLVPFVSDLVPDVDVAAGRVVIADRPGLLEPADDQG
jgi:16S rRNA processing protein RimM